MDNTNRGRGSCDICDFNKSKFYVKFDIQLYMMKVFYLCAVCMFLVNPVISDCLFFFFVFFFFFLKVFFIGKLCYNFTSITNQYACLKLLLLVSGLPFLTQYYWMVYNRYCKPCIWESSASLSKNAVSAFQISC